MLMIITSVTIRLMTFFIIDTSSLPLLFLKMDI